MTPKKLEESRQAVYEIPFNLQYKCSEVPIFPISKSTPLFSTDPFFSTLRSRSTKWLMNILVNYHPSHSELTSRINPPHISMDSCKKFISSEYFLNFFSNLYIPPWLGKSFKFTVLRLLKKTFVSEKIESVHLYLCSQAKLSLPDFYHHRSRQKEIINFPWITFFENLFFPSRKGAGPWS